MIWVSYSSEQIRVRSEFVLAPDSQPPTSNLKIKPAPAPTPFLDPLAAIKLSAPLSPRLFGFVSGLSDLEQQPKKNLK